MIEVAHMRIGEAATKAAVNVQTLRYYERVGLLPAPARQSSGYRAYDLQTVRRVRFIERAQELGFTLAQIGDLLSLREQSESACRGVELRASSTLDRIAQKIRDLERMREALEPYVAACQTRGTLGECPLLRALEHSTD
ncbi:MAG: MerR family transcriptional regulator [Gemmatimonadaceae bacterium]